MKNLIILFFLPFLFLSKSIGEPIGEGAIALTTTPREADIYINGKLLGNSTPIVLKLPEGKHLVEIKKVGKQTQKLNILILDGVVLSKKVILLDLPEPPQKSIKLSDMLDPKRDAFETEEEFQERRLQLLDNFNQAVQQQSPGYQAGIVYLDKTRYEIDSQKFPVHIEWQSPWAKAFDLPSQGYITAKRDDAKVLWDTGSQKSLYLYVEGRKNKLTHRAPVLIGLGKEWTVHFNQHLPTTLLMTWQGDKESISLAAFNSNLSIFASVTGNIIKLWEVTTGKRLHTLKGHKDKVSSVVFSPKGDMLVSGSMDSTIKLWKASTGELISTLGAELFFSAGHKKAVTSLAFTSNGKQLVSGGADKTVKVWEVSTGKVLHTLTGHKDEITSIAVTTLYDNISVIASGSQDKMIKLWFNSVPLYTLKGHEDTIQSLVFSPDGKLLASGSRDETIKLWRIPPCGPPRTLQVLESDVISLAFSPIGNILASVSGSNINLWNVESGEILKTLQQDVLGKSVAFSSNGQKLASIGELSSIKLWESVTKLEHQE
jgi:WD40 repeat protein